jgi:hypothetical protein
MARVNIFRLAATKSGQEAGVKLVRKAMLEVEVGAKVLAAGGTYSTGRLSESIHSDGPHIRGLIVTASVGSKLDYALLVHNGAKIHPIFPKGMHRYRFGAGSRRRPQLHFFWRRAGRSAFFPQIPGARSTIGRSHPGQKGKHYLSIPLRIVGRRYRFRVFTTDV